MGTNVTQLLPSLELGGVVKDKNSLFRCFSLPLFGYHGSFREIKSKIGQHIGYNWNDFKDLLALNEEGALLDSRSYKKALFQGMRGGLPEFLTMSEIYQLPVTVYSPRNEITYIGQGRPGREISILVSGDEGDRHFDLFMSSRVPVRQPYRYALALGNQFESAVVIDTTGNSKVPTTNQNPVYLTVEQGQVKSQVEVINKTPVKPVFRKHPKQDRKISCQLLRKSL